MRNNTRPSISVPTEDPKSLHRSVEQLKEAVEIMQGQRGKDNMDTAVRWGDLVKLGLIAEEDVPPFGRTL